MTRAGPSYACDASGSSPRPPRRALCPQRPYLLGRFVARDAERLAVVELVAAALARGPDVVRVPAGHQQPPAPPAVVRRERLPQALAAPDRALVRCLLRVLTEGHGWNS